jgi:divalent metal cation (Fe/Co/Zn/Cd) transporter
VLAGAQSIHKLAEHGATRHVGWASPAPWPGASWADPVAGLAVTVFICHVGWEVTTDVTRRLLDRIDSAVITAAEAAASSVPGVRHAHARARWTGRVLRVEIEGRVDAATTTVADADALGRLVADRIARDLPQARSLIWTACAV